MQTVRRVAVLGAGTMGSRIAAHFANAGIPALLLDIVVPDQPDRNFAARKGIETAAKQKPVAFFTEAAMQLVTPGNFEDSLGEVQRVDWVIEAVTENLSIKRGLFENIARWRRPGTVVSTNTSGIPLAHIAEGFSPEFRRHFFGTHFFNPPRYLHLLELIPGPETAPEVLRFAAEFCDLRLGKGIVSCKDTPNFIGNRIGAFFGGTVQKLMLEGDYTIEEVDALTGPLIGLPRTASARLLDVIGLDVWAHVAHNLYELVPDDPWRDRFLLPDYLARMIERKWLGEKTGQGMYKRVGKGAEKEIQALDWKTLEYHPQQKVKFPSVEAAKQIESLPERLRTLVNTHDRAGDFLWKLFSDVFLYSAERIPEISERIVEIDRAMRWGYAHKLGPFEYWDALGVRETVARMRAEGRSVPESVERLLESDADSFYRAADAERIPRTEYFDLARGKWSTLEDRPGVIVLSDLKRARGVVKRNPGASLIDVGDGVLCLEFHGKMNALGEDQMEMVCAGIEETSRNFEAMIIANQGENFSAGANLMLILVAAQDQEWDELDAAVRRFQQAHMSIKYAPRPVVAAPFNLTLGGGCETALHAARIQASAELYMGLVEVGVGLIPGAGGCKEMLIRLGDAKACFELIGFAKVSSSAEDARRLGLLRATDCVSMNPERLVADAKDLALSLAPAWTPGVPRTDITVGGNSAYALMKVGAYIGRKGEHISDYDMEIAERLAYVLSGGRVSGTQQVSEQYLLDLEREAFLSLCGRPKTQERIQHML
ncbi:MAG TPA: 3-hydroxyacyl-CoA dehydrogenase/enoyl-CoA hydratase family protein, partial [Bryobacteraceae bacterium]|nr:3-hydroxyacyl-CoA dehydrogenase/enoyl-CoA hydratase family protein [Bryobacteraceae bacterium]